jgi:hypothetical protein
MRSWRTSRKKDDLATSVGSDQEYGFEGFGKGLLSVRYEDFWKLWVISDIGSFVNSTRSYYTCYRRIRRRSLLFGLRVMLLGPHVLDNPPPLRAFTQSEGVILIIRNV